MILLIMQLDITNYKEGSEKMKKGKKKMKMKTKTKMFEHMAKKCEAKSI